MEKRSREWLEGAVEVLQYVHPVAKVFPPGEEMTPAGSWLAVLRAELAAIPPGQPDELATLRSDVERLKKERLNMKDMADCPSCNGQSTKDDCAMCSNSGFVGMWERDAYVKAEISADLAAALAQIAELRGAGSDLIDAIRRPMGAAVWTCVERFEAMATTPPPAALASFTARVKAEALRELIAEVDRQKPGIIRAFGDVSVGDVLGIAVEMIEHLEAKQNA